MSDSTENTSKPSCEQLEARVVAMLLGEASPFEEEQLREQLKGDAALAKFCAEIGQTLPLLNEALDVGQAPKAKSAKPRLAGKRRSKLKLLSCGWISARGWPSPLRFARCCLSPPRCSCRVWSSPIPTCQWRQTANRLNILGNSLKPRRSFG